MSSISTQGETETLTTLALHSLLILIEYKPPSLENLKYLIYGGHTTLNKIYDSLVLKFTTEDCVIENLHASIYDDLTVNEYARMFKVVHGKINMDPLFHGLVQYFRNVIYSANTSIPGSITQIPFMQEVFVLTWRLITLNHYAFDDFTQRKEF